MAALKSPNYDELFAKAADILSGPRPGTAETEARLRLWKNQEWHNWFRWRVCARGFDWSKPVWIGLLLLGFVGLIAYGLGTGKWFVTAGGIVLWFTVVNLAFFTYFGLSLPGPPRSTPGPFEPGRLLRAELGLYPAGYERRKFARMLLRVKAPEPPDWLIELAQPALEPELHAVLLGQSLARMHAGDAPTIDAIIETLPVSRAEIDAGAFPVRVVAWNWDDQKIRPLSGGSRR